MPTPKDTNSCNTCWNYVYVINLVTHIPNEFDKRGRSPRKVCIGKGTAWTRLLKMKNKDMDDMASLTRDVKIWQLRACATQLLRNEALDTNRMCHVFERRSRRSVTPKEESPSRDPKSHLPQVILHENVSEEKRLQARLAQINLQHKYQTKSMEAKRRNIVAEFRQKFGASRMSRRSRDEEKIDEDEDDLDDLEESRIKLMTTNHSTPPCPPCTPADGLGQTILHSQTLDFPGECKLRQCTQRGYCAGHKDELPDRELQRGENSRKHPMAPIVLPPIYLTAGQPGRTGRSFSSDDVSICSSLSETSFPAAPKYCMLYGTPPSGRTNTVSASKMTKKHDPPVAANATKVDIRFEM